METFKEKTEALLKDFIDDTPNDPRSLFYQKEK